MSHHATDWAFTAPKAMASGDRFVLVCLADHADPEGLCYPSISRIARMTGLHRATVYRAIERLCADWGVVQKISSGGNRLGHKGRTNVYRLQVGPWRLPTEYADHAIQPQFDPEVLDPELRMFEPFLETDSSPQGSHHATNEGSHSATNDLKGRTTQPQGSHSATGRVAPCDNTQNIYRTINEPRDALGSPVDNPDAWHMIPEEIRQSGLSHIAALKDQLAKRPASTDALEAGGAE